MLKNKVYDFLKWFAIVGLHALGVAYGQLANIWALPYSEAIPETLDIVGVLLGAFLAWESYQFSKENEILVAPRVQPDYSQIPEADKVNNYTVNSEDI